MKKKHTKKKLLKYLSFKIRNRENKIFTVTNYRNIFETTPHSFLKRGSAGLRSTLLYNSFWCSGCSYICIIYILFYCYSAIKKNSKPIFHYFTLEICTDQKWNKMEKLETDKLLKTTLQDKINYYSFKTMVILINIDIQFEF